MGNAAISSQARSIVDESTSVTINCDDGYLLQNSEESSTTITCQADNSWSSSTVQCVGKVM